MPPFRALKVHQLSVDFRAATKIVEVPELPVASPGNVVVQNHYVGINATDINMTNGAYVPRPVPFSCGLEGVGVITAVGEGVGNIQIGDAVVYQQLGAFAEYIEVPSFAVIKVPTPDPAMLPLMICATSGSIALEVVGHMKSGETILVTSAAGGTGQIVVQLAKLAGNHVIATCSSDGKVGQLKKLGCDRVINYSKEDIRDVLKNEYPKGIDLIFETIGGDMFKAAVENVAVHGRIVVFGFIAGYKDDQKGFAPYALSEVNPTLLMRSASVRGFFLGNHVTQIPAHTSRLLKLIENGKLTLGVDPTPFIGLEGVADAFDHMYAKKNIGKVAIKLV
ncbi:hypothetical protein Poli38472_007808 [Pythium oligandrum]|uniref:Enoyl reductase (ER) domain-containing protein n=1 Tax=Pythium oligandrum TaxID=41045 RepID=A0A8K1CQT9_PYTOL|nr:hypothetical protein Poli38472_007808 [Pythium oligandrum]|eukprot:TMW68136.1 hypothetical protein Poli38472_007808 [Pythium oligandrum]